MLGKITVIVTMHCSYLAENLSLELNVFSLVKSLGSILHAKLLKHGESGRVICVSIFVCVCLYVT